MRLLALTWRKDINIVCPRTALTNEKTCAHHALIGLRDGARQAMEFLCVVIPYRSPCDYIWHQQNTYIPFGLQNRGANPLL